MPSQLAENNARMLNAVSLKKKSQAAVGQPTQTIQVRGPFSGYSPDIDPNLIDGTSFSAIQNCLALSVGSEHGEVLGLPDGYRQIDWAHLPLGDSSPPAAAADKVVVRVDQFGRFAPTDHASAPGDFTGEFISTPMATTAGNGTTGTGTAGTGFMYRIAASGAWTIVNPSASMAATTRQLSAGRNGRGTASPSMPDSCTAPFGATTRDANTGGADDKTSGAIKEPCWIYTNDVDEVMVFPSSSVETNAGTHAYEPLIDHITAVSLDSGTTGGFKCKSVETWNGRVYFLNTSEATVRRAQRLRRTAKFTADPDITLAGSGFYDFREFQGEGLRIETLGDVLACYFSDGVAFMRPTGNPTSPDEPQIVATERGLIGTHAMTAIGRNVHFGIFTDGWWLLDQSGRWQEVGISNINNKVAHKWRETFYSLLSTTYRHRLYCYYDQPSNLVYIAVPTADNPSPTQVWIYDPSADRVFIENYPVSCFGTYTPLSQAGIPIDSLVGSIDSQTATIDSFAPVVGFPKVRVHGDELGFVYKHSPAYEGYDPQVISNSAAPNPQDPAWSFSLGLRSPTGMRNLTTVDRVSLEYFNHGNNGNVAVTVAGPSADGSEAASVLLNSGGGENLRYRDAWFRYSSTSPGITVAGSGSYHIRALEVDVMADPLEPRGT